MKDPFMKLWLILFRVAVFCALCGQINAAAAAPAKPNILFILADDLGLDGVSCYGADKRSTPNIDKLAASGMRFETCYSAPLCGPSRCALMTGTRMSPIGRPTLR